MRSGWWSAQRDDYPITVKSGHSVSEVIISPDEIHYSGVDKPDVLVVVSDDGLGKSGPYLESMDSGGVVYAAAGLDLPRTEAKVVTVDPASAETRIPSASLALAMVASAIHHTGLVSFESFEATAGEGSFGDKNLELVAVGTSLATS
jgi:Pyruvate/2-oxoacid:ferredoxin oxidoreductase gamma subunit